MIYTVLFCHFNVFHLKYSFIVRNSTNPERKREKKPISGMRRNEKGERVDRKAQSRDRQNGSACKAVLYSTISGYGVTRPGNPLNKQRIRVQQLKLSGCVFSRLSKTILKPDSRQRTEKLSTGQTGQLFSI